MHPISESEYAELMARLSIETDRRRGKLTTALDEAKVSTSQKRIQKKAKITFCPAQDMTVARTKALLDVRPSFLWACFCLAFSAHLPGIYKWNADGTTFEINTNGTGEVYAIIRQKDDHSLLTSLGTAAELAIFIKFMALISAAGEFGETVFIVAVDDMSVGEFYVCDVNLLSFNLGVGSKGKLYFCNSRAGNAALWKHWLLHCVIPTLETCRDSHNFMVIVLFAR